MPLSREECRDRIVDLTLGLGILGKAEVRDGSRSTTSTKKASRSGMSKAESQGRSWDRGDARTSEGTGRPADR